MPKAKIIFGLIFSVSAAWAGTDDSLTTTINNCKAFTRKLDALPKVTYGTAMVPKDWSSKNSAEPKLPLFWWKREGTDKSAPPIAFLHGGVAGNSWALLDRWQDILDKYPGDVVSFDHRGEGCSKTLPSNLLPSEYAHLNVRAVVHDMEYLREQVFNYRKWRVVGHSRGSALIHYYLEMSPQGLESAHAMGFALAPLEIQRLQTLVRAQGFYRTAKAYLQKYPGDDVLVQRIRSYIKPDTCWLALDHRRVCGPGVLDVFANLLSRSTSWADLHAKLGSMVDFNSTYEAIKARLPADVYGHLGYILGTNSMAFGSPDSVMTGILRDNPVYTDPFLSELRYIGDVLAPTIPYEWKGGVDEVDFAKIKRFLTSHPNFEYYLYSGEVDPIAPPQVFRWEVEYLGRSVNLITLPEWAHDGWFHPLLIKQITAL